MEKDTPLEFLEELIKLKNKDYAIGFIDGIGEVIKVLKMNVEKETSKDDVSD